MDQSEKIDAAIEAHAQWAVSLRMAIVQGGSEFTPEAVRSDKNCEFGKWFYGDFPAQFKKLPIYQEIKELHANFHKEAAKVLELALQKKREEALNLMDIHSEFKRLSIALMIKLNHLNKL